MDTHDFNKPRFFPISHASWVTLQLLNVLWGIYVWKQRKLNRQSQHSTVTQKLAASFRLTDDFKNHGSFVGNPFSLRTRVSRWTAEEDVNTDWNDEAEGESALPQAQVCPLIKIITATVTGFTTFIKHSENFETTPSFNLTFKKTTVERLNTLYSQEGVWLTQTSYNKYYQGLQTSAVLCELQFRVFPCEQMWTSTLSLALLRPSVSTVGGCADVVQPHSILSEGTQQELQVTINIKVICNVLIKTDHYLSLHTVRLEEHRLLVATSEKWQNNEQQFRVDESQLYCHYAYNYNYNNYTTMKCR